jgi:glutaredoxin 3
MKHTGRRETHPRPETIMTDVTIYTREYCGYCARAKALLDTKGIPYVEHDATYSKELRAEMIEKANGHSTFPQIFINGEHVGGCDDLHALDRQGKLDAMLAQ